jgi:uncharacterized repeat protein (TIGR03803 family)
MTRVDFEVRASPTRHRLCKFFREAGGALLLGLFWLTPAAHADTEATLHEFVIDPPGGSPQQTGFNPDGTLVRDPAGALYGANLLGGIYNDGTLFKLSPPALGQTDWTLSVLHTFTGWTDGNWPSAGLVLDASGALYGTTQFGGANSNGVVFKLSPPAADTDSWQETVLHDFTYDFAYGDHDGAGPAAGLIMDGSGTLYGTTAGGGTPDRSGNGFGTVFKLSPPAAGMSQWQETVLYRFAGGSDGRTPISALQIDSAGRLYGSTLYGGKGPCTDWEGFVVGCGTLFVLTPPGTGETSWTKTTLYAFSGGSDGGAPRGQLLRDLSGTLVGTTYQGGTGACTDGWNVIGCGTVYVLRPPASGQADWTETVIHSFDGSDGAFPQGGVIMSGGALYGMASGGGQGGTGNDGVAFRLTPPGPAQTSWTETVLHNFDISTSGQTPAGELAVDSTGQLFGVAYGGGAGSGGTIFAITR